MAPLGISLSEFFNEGGETNILNNKEKELLSYYRMLPDDKAELYLQLGKALQQK